jgi:hypothetical protein
MTGFEEVFMMIPSVDFFGRKVTRLILGDNPFNGHSYIEDIHSGDEMIDYYTADNCVKALFEAEQNGINTYMALAEPFVLRVVRQYKNEGGKMNIMFQTYPALDLEVNLQMMLKCSPVGIYHQGGTADLYCENGQVDILRQRIKIIKDSGIPAGLGTHVPETVLQAEEEGWGADFYVTCLYNARRTQRGQQSGFITGKSKALVFYPEDRFLMFDVIKQVEKPFIAFKIFAGGQVFIGRKPEEVPYVAEAFVKETYENIKPSDMVMVGVFQKYKNQIKENTDIVKNILNK